MTAPVTKRAGVCCFRLQKPLKRGASHHQEHQTPRQSPQCQRWYARHFLQLWSSECQVARRRVQQARHPCITKRSEFRRTLREMFNLLSPKFAHERLKTFLHGLHETFFQHTDDIRTIYECCQSIAKPPQKATLAVEQCRQKVEICTSRLFRCFITLHNDGDKHVWQQLATRDSKCNGFVKKYVHVEQNHKPNQSPDDEESGADDSVAATNS